MSAVAMSVCSQPHASPLMDAPCTGLVPHLLMRWSNCLNADGILPKDAPTVQFSENYSSQDMQLSDLNHFHSLNK